MSREPPYGWVPGKENYRPILTLFECALYKRYLRVSDIFKGQDEKRLRRTLFEQFCYILAAGCDYTGRDMREAHKNMGLERDDLNALVENLQKAMSEKKIAFRHQNRFLAKLAPMEADVLQK